MRRVTANPPAILMAVIPIVTAAIHMISVAALGLLVYFVSYKLISKNQEKLWSFIVADIDALSDHRFIRLDAALAKPPIYICVIIFGFLVTMECFGAYRPQGPLVALVSLYTVFVGLVLFLIVKLSDPFQGDIGVAPTAFEYLVEAL